MAEDPAQDLRDYLADHYGRCRRAGACRCLRGGWRGRACPDWTPAGARDWDELRQYGVAQYADYKRRPP